MSATGRTGGPQVEVSYIYRIPSTGEYDHLSRHRGAFRKVRFVLQHHITVNDRVARYVLPGCGKEKAQLSFKFMSFFIHSQVNTDPISTGKLYFFHQLLKMFF